MADDSGSVGGKGGPGSVGGAGDAASAHGADSDRGISAGDRSDVSNASASVSADDVGAQADKVTGPAADWDGYDQPDAAAASAVGRPPSEGTVAEEKRRADEAVDKSADELAAASPTAASLVSGFRAAGGTFQASATGSYFDKTAMTINISGATDTERMQLISHELG